MRSGGVPAETIAVSFWLRSEPPWKPAMYEMSIAQPCALPHSSSSSRTKALWSGWKSWFCRICSLPLTLAPDFGFWIAATPWTTDCDGAGVAVAAPAAAGAVVAAAAGLAPPAAGLVAAAAGAVVAAAAGFGASVGLAGAAVGEAAPPQACRIGAAAASPIVNDVHVSRRRRPIDVVRGSRVIVGSTLLREIGQRVIDGRDDPSNAARKVRRRGRKRAAIYEVGLVGCQTGECAAVRALLHAVRRFCRLAPT